MPAELDPQARRLLDVKADVGDLPVLTGLDFGYTQPMLTLPYGALAEFDCDHARLTILEAGLY